MKSKTFRENCLKTPYLKSLQLQSLIFGGLVLIASIWPPLAYSQTGQFLQNGEEVITTITAGGQTRFSFRVDNAGAGVVSVGQVNGSNGALEIAVVDSNEETIGTSIDASNSGFPDAAASVEFSTSQSGIFHVDVFNFSFGDTEIRIRAFAGSSETPTLINDRDVAPMNGQEFLTRTPLGTFAIFPFQVDSTGSVIATVSSFTGVSRLQIFDPDGSLLAADGGFEFDQTANASFDANKTGTYTAVASSDANVFSNEAFFQTRILVVAQDAELVSDREVALENGQEFTSSVPSGAFSVFPIQVASAGTIFISVGETSSSAQAEPQISLYDPNGNLVAVDGSTNASHSQAFIQAATSQAGRYTAVVSDFSKNDDMEFRMRVLTLPDSPALIDGRDVAILKGQEEMASFQSGSFSIFQFRVDAAGTVELIFDDFDRTFNLQSYVVTPDGNLVDAEIDTASYVEFNATQTGTYTGVVRALEDLGGTNKLISIRARGISDSLAVLLGDCDQNGVVDFSDIAPFITTLSTGVYLAEADVDENEIVDFDDISPFIVILAS